MSLGHIIMIYSANSLKQQYTGRHVTRTHYHDSNQSLPLLLNAACGEEANINFIVWFDPSGAEPMICPTRGKFVMLFCF